MSNLPSTPPSVTSPPEGSHLRLPAPGPESPPPTQSNENGCERGVDPVAAATQVSNLFVLLWPRLLSHVSQIILSGSGGSQIGIADRFNTVASTGVWNFPELIG